MIKTQPIYDPLYLDEDKFIYLITGGRGSGKSFNVSTFLSRLSFTAGHKILFSRYTMSSAKDSVIPEFNEKIELDGFEEYFKVNVNDIKNTFSGSEIIFRGIKAGSGNQTAKLKSLTNLTVFVVDEGEEWESEEEFEKIMLSIRGKGIHNRVIIIMNPSDENHFVYRRYIKNTHKIVDYDGAKVQISTHPDVLHIHTSYLDNVENLSEEFLAIAQRTKETNKKKYDHIFMGRWADKSEGAIFKDITLIDRMPISVDNLVIGIDYGYTNDPTACTLVGIEGDNLYLKELFYLKGMKTKEIADKLKEYDLKVISESADPRLIDEIAEYGINIIPVNKGDVNGVGSIKAGINKMLEMNIHVTEDSLNLREEFRKYSWEKDKNGQLTTRPIDGYNHCFTGDTLISTLDGLKPIKDVKVGDLVLTSSGYNRVLKTFDNGIKEVTRYVINGVELKATPNHKIRVGDGWKEISKLTTEDIIITSDYTPSLISKIKHWLYGCLDLGECNYSVVNELHGECIGSERVYDLMVENSHEYFANGILVHNCIDGIRYCILMEVMKVGGGNNGQGIFY